MFTFTEPRTNDLIRLLRAHPEGVTLREIEALLPLPPPHRTLQRWIAHLVFAGLVTRRGGSKYVRYYGDPSHRPIKPRKPKLPEPKQPESVPEPSRLPPEYQRLFDRLAPTIIRTGLVDDTARSELGMGFCRVFPGADVEVMNGFITACEEEFDRLDRDTALTKYAVKPADWADWRKEWCELRDLPPEE